MWSKEKTIEDVVVVGIEEGGLYKLKGHSDVALTHSTKSPCELWHRRLVHIKYKALPYVSKVVIGLQELKVDHEGICKGCAQRKNIIIFQRETVKWKESWNLSTQMYAVQCHQPL